MAKLEIFIGYLGLTPQYHEIEIPNVREGKIGVPIEAKTFIEKPMVKSPLYFGRIASNYKKFNKRFVQKIKSNERK